MTKLRRSPSNKSWGAGSCDSNASTVVDRSDQYGSSFYTDHASFLEDPSSTSTLHRLLTKISSLFSSDRSETISDISSTKGVPLQKGTRDHPDKHLQRRPTKRQLLAELDSYAGEARITTSSRHEHRAENRLSLIQLPIRPIRYYLANRLRHGGQTPSRHTPLVERRN
jgi:hypothetical protein